ncbi:MAG TPA: SAM-dependent methyltransferase [Pseudonocardiaceae bacterium]|nr:SAM-dependent methyltransferase [Pseudonocardiaceae bacterium]
MDTGVSAEGAEPNEPPVVIDATKATIARVYDAFLDGTDNYEADRQVMNEVLRVAPQAKLVAQAMRRWQVRVTRYAVRMGIDQFLDCGSGMPVADNTHQIAQRHNPEAVVIYVDSDPIVATHARALLVENDRTHFVSAEFTRPKILLTHPTVTRHLDFTRPIMLLQCATLHHVNDEAGPAQIMAEYVDALPPGSLVGLTHFWDPEDGGEQTALARQIEASFRTSSMGTSRYRTRAEIQAMLEGLELIEPGLVELDQWWPEGPALSQPYLIERLILGALGRKPGPS